MGLFDIFSNDAAEQAAAARKAGLQQGYDALSTQYGAGRDALSSGYTLGNDTLASGFGAGRDALASGYSQGTGAVNASYGAGRDALTSAYGAALQPYQTLFNQSQQGANAYGDATGANGAAGYARALANFQTNPGYQFQFDQGLQAIDRGAASRGMVTSGNLLNAEQQYGTGLANQSYNSYVAGLAPYLQQGATAAGGIANVNTGYGNAVNANYTGQGGLVNSNYVGAGQGANANYTGQATGQNANYTNLANANNASYIGQGGAANANYTGQGNADAAADLNKYNVGLNQFNALMGGVKLAAGAMGGLGGLGGIAGGLTNGGGAINPGVAGGGYLGTGGQIYPGPGQY